MAVNAIGLELVADGFTSPVVLAQAPDDTGRLFVADQVGVVQVVSPRGEVLETPFLDVSDKLVELRESFDERGLLGLAFHPEYANNGRLFVYYSVPLREQAPDDFDHTSRISEYTVMSGDANRVDPASEKVILEVDQPQFNHNAGALTFGPDGFLYVALGDGGDANDTGIGHPPRGNGQDVTTLLGSILRLDVDAAGSEAYGIPADNPFVGTEGRDEIYAYGFRNPFRMSFDQGGDRVLFVGDAGQNRWEEVDRVQRGGNYGWNIKEGTHCFDPQMPDVNPENCPDQGHLGNPLIDPIIEYQNAGVEGGIGLAVIGGYVYRGDDIEGLTGEYIFGDYSADSAQPEGKIFAATPPADGEGLWDMRELSIPANEGGDLGFFMRAFGQTADGEVYALVSGNAGPTGNTGRVYRVTAADRTEPPVDAGAPDASQPDASAPDAGAGDAGDVVAAQISRGTTLFADNCARCHGANGMGTALGPMVIGAGALPLNPPPERDVRMTQFRTALDVFLFASQNMPLDDPGSLPDQTYLDVLAFVLDANGVALTQPLTRANADTVVINP